MLQKTNGYLIPHTPKTHPHDKQNVFNYINDFISPTRSFWTIKGTKGRYTSSMTLEDFRDKLRQIQQKQSPQDYSIAPNTLGFNFDNGVAQCRRITDNKSPEWQWFFDQNGWNQFAKLCLPRSGGNFIEETMNIHPVDVDVEQLENMKQGIRQLAASIVMAHCTGYNKPLMFRTVQKRVGQYVNADGITKDITGCFIRAVLSEQYAPYSNLEFVETILSTIGNMGVYRMNLSDMGMTLKLIDIEKSVEDLSVNEEIAMITALNSEVGLKKAKIASGILQKVCSNGMTSFRTESSIESVHRGDQEKMKEKIASGMIDIQEGQRQLLQDFAKAKTIHFKNGYEWMTKTVQRLGKVNNNIILNIINAMNDEQYASHSPNTLAGICDGITLLAQSDEFDVFEQLELEELASKVLDHGLRLPN